MHIVVNTVNGTLYCYAAECIWNPGEKKYSKPSKAVGKIDGVNGFVPNKFFSDILQRKENAPESVSTYEQRIIDTVKMKYGENIRPKLFPKSNAAKIANVIRTASIIRHGPQLVFESITQKYMIDSKLSNAFGDKLASDILALAWYITSEGKALSNSDSWLDYFENPKGRGFSSQEISRLLDLIDYDGIMTFYKLWLQSFVGTDTDKVLYDLTSISYYGSGIHLADWGYSRDLDELPQVNYALLCLRNSGMPLFSWPLSGSISDVSTLENTLKFLSNLGYKPNCLMLDRGFASQSNIAYMLQYGYTFLQALRVNANWVYDIIDAGQITRLRPDSMLEMGSRTYFVSSTNMWWVRTQKHRGKRVKEESFFWRSSSNGEPYSPQEGETVEVLEQYPAQAHVLFCQELVGNSWVNFMKNLNRENQRLLDNPKAGVKPEYAPFFSITKPKYARKKIVDFNMEAIAKYKKDYAGFICLLTNDPTIKTAKDALSEYATRAYIERDFDEMKNELDMNRIRVHADNRMRSRLFIQFIAEILLREIRVQLSQSEVCRKMTKTQIFSHIKAISKIHFDGKYDDMIPQLSKNQRSILEALKIKI